MNVVPRTYKLMDADQIPPELDKDAPRNSMQRFVRHWDRLHWAVGMRSKSRKPDEMLIGVSWHKITPPIYEGEPSRPLLFHTRSQARKWCAAKTIECARHSPDWRFRPVRVREMILPNVGALPPVTPERILP